MSETVTLKGQPFTLKGKLVKEKKTIPDCTLIGQDLKPVKLSSFKGKILLLISVPSLDTDVCSKEVYKFHKEIERFGDQVHTVVVSMDLPFAQKRWCTAESVSNLTTLSDFNFREFGENFGVLISELGLLARAVFICDPDLELRHLHLVKEVTEEPNYDKILNQTVDLLATVDSE